MTEGQRVGSAISFIRLPDRQTTSLSMAVVSPAWGEKGEAKETAVVAPAVIKAPSKSKTVAQEKLRQFVLENIQHRCCTKFVPDPKKAKDELCLCGHKKDFEGHQHLGDENPTSWSAAPVTATSFGEINFVGFGREASKRAPYVRVDSETEVSTLWELVKDHWKAPPAKLIISITGGAKRFDMKERLRNTFKRGLISAATSADAWIVTGGTCTGVMSIVGEAVKEYVLQTGGTERKMVVLGVAPWGVVPNKKALESAEGIGCFPCKYKVEALNNPDEQGRAPLDPNHTHFVLVDDGTEGKYGTEIQMRVKLEQYIATETGINVPIVLLVLEGGENTLKTVYEAILKKTPTVVIQGSGRAADFIAYAYIKNKSIDKKSKKAADEFSADLKEQAREAFDWSKTDPSDLNKKLQTCVESALEIIKHKYLLTVFQLDDSGSTNEIDKAILLALMQANKKDAQSQLSLALAWNCCDVARQDIFSLHNRLNWQHIDLYEPMFTALVEDKMEFVQLLLDCGVQLKKFLTVERLEALYKDVLLDQHADVSATMLLNMILERKQSVFSRGSSESGSEKSQIVLADVGRVINALSKDHRCNIYGKRKNQNAEAEMEKTNYAFIDEEQTEKVVEAPVVQPASFKIEPERDLLYWALLLNRHELAMLFWRMSRDQIGGALTASMLMSAMAETADREEETDLSDTLKSQADEFQELAVGILNTCYQKDKRMAQLLLTRELDLWGGRTLFMIADVAELMDFMEHSCCQTLLNKSWTGQIALQTPTWKVFLGLLLLFVPLIKFTKREDSVLTDDDDDARDEAADGAPVQHGKTYNVTACRKEDSISFGTAIYYFLCAPIVKFCYYTISYVIFLGLYSFFLLTNLKPWGETNSPGVAEFVLWAWVATLLLEEVRQAAMKESNSSESKFWAYISSSWNQFDICLYVLFTVTVILRCALHTDYFIWARMCYVMVLMMYFLRFLQVFFVEKNVGPKVIIIQRMLTDMMLFLLLLAVFIVSYGVAAQALLYPNQPVSWTILKNVLFQPYFQIYGQLNTDEVLGHHDPCSDNETIYTLDASLGGLPRCPEQTWLPMVLFCIDLLLTNILLLNLLIAMFNFTFTKVQENSEKVWRFHRYGLIYEYYDKPIFAPPLIFLNHIWRIFAAIHQRCNKTVVGEQDDFRRILSKDENNKLSAFERAGMEILTLRLKNEEREHIGFKVTSASMRIEKVIDDLETLRENLNSQGASGGGETLETIKTVSEVARPGYDARKDIDDVNHRLDAQEKLLREVLNVLQATKVMRAAATPSHMPNVEIADFNVGFPKP